MMFSKISILLGLASSTAVTVDAAKVSGWLYDNLCINNCEGTSGPTSCTPDGSNAFYTPAVHTGECLLFDFCVVSGHSIMSEFPGEDGRHSIVLKLVDAANTTAYELVKNSGITTAFPKVEAVFEDSQVVSTDADGVPSVSTLTSLSYELVTVAPPKDPWAENPEKYYSGAPTTQAVCNKPSDGSINGNNMCFRSDVEVSTEDDMLVIESNGCPDHMSMMGGSNGTIEDENDFPCDVFEFAPECSKDKPAGCCGGACGCGGKCGGCNACSDKCNACSGKCSACGVSGCSATECSSCSAKTCGTCSAASCGATCSAGGCSSKTCGTCSAASCGATCSTGGCSSKTCGTCAAASCGATCSAGCSASNSTAMTRALEGCSATTCSASCASTSCGVGCSAGGCSSKTCSACSGGCSSKTCSSCSGGCSSKTCGACSTGCSSKTCGACSGGCSSKTCGACGTTCGASGCSETIGKYTPTFQHYTMKIPKAPGVPGDKQLLKGDVVGLMFNGVILDSHKQTWAYDMCNGHSDENHQYHYHIPQSCYLESMGVAFAESPNWWINDAGDKVREFDEMAAQFPATAPASPVIGMALDGFPIYGLYDDKGELQRSKAFGGSLDECNGKMDSKSNYGYYLSADPPFAPACLKGSKIGTFEYSSYNKACPKEGIKNTIQLPSDGQVKGDDPSAASISIPYLSVMASMMAFVSAFFF